MVVVVVAVVVQIYVFYYVFNKYAENAVNTSEINSAFKGRAPEGPCSLLGAQGVRPSAQN